VERLAYDGSEIQFIHSVLLRAIYGLETPVIVEAFKWSSEIKLIISHFSQQTTIN